MVKPNDVGKMIEDAGGTVQEMGLLPDGSGFATASFPLRKDHWLFDEGDNVPPMPFRLRGDDPRRAAVNDMVRAAARHAIRATTMNGKEEDFDPDAMVQNFVVGMLGYHSADALCGETSGDPSPVPLGIASGLDAAISGYNFDRRR